MNTVRIKILNQTQFLRQPGLGRFCRVPTPEGHPAKTPDRLEERTPSAGMNRVIHTDDVISTDPMVRSPIPGASASAPADDQRDIIEYERPPPPCPTISPRPRLLRDPVYGSVGSFRRGSGRVARKLAARARVGHPGPANERDGYG